MLHLFAPFLHRGSHQTKNPVRVMLMVHFSQIAIETYEKVSFCSPATKKSSPRSPCPGRCLPDFYLGSSWCHGEIRINASVPWVPKTQQKPRHLLPYLPSILHVYMGLFVWPDFFHQVGYGLTNHIHLFSYFQVTFNTPNYHMLFFIFEVSRVYIPLPTSWYFFFCHQKKLMNFWSPQMVPHEDLGVVGLPGAFRLSCHHQHAGGQDSLLAKQ